MQNVSAIVYPNYYIAAVLFPLLIFGSSLLFLDWNLYRVADCSTQGLFQGYKSQRLTFQ